jgi:hypothetical protein
MKSFIVQSFVVVGIVACGLAAPGSAAACGGGDWEFSPPVDPRPKGLDMSEKDLADGKYERAAARVIRMFPELRKATIGIEPNVDRAYRILAVATARKSGALAIDREVPKQIQGTWLGATGADRSANLLWSADAMTRLNDKKRDDSALQSELGEVLAKVDGRTGEALALLGKLADKDLLASPEAYAALAALRGRTGDAPGREAAIKKCEAMAKEKGACSSEPLAGTLNVNGRS